MSMKNIETNRLLLRKFKEDDAKLCYQNFGQEKELGRFLPMYPVQSEEAMKQMISGFVNAYENDAFIWLIEEKSSGQPIGYLCVDIPYRELEIGEISYLLGAKYQGNGYAKEAAQAVISFMFREEKLKLIEAKYNEKNTSSGKLLERLHFTKEAVLRDRRKDGFTGEQCGLVVCSLKENEKGERCDEKNI